MDRNRHDNEEETTRRSSSKARPRDSSKMGKYRVRAGHTVTAGTGEVDDNERAVTRVFQPGEEIELSETEAEAIPHAVEKGERRAHDGQNARLKRQIAGLEKQIDERNELLKSAGKKDPELQKAIDSLKKRGDNYMARNEPDPWGADASTLAGYDGSTIDDADPDAMDAEDMAGGMKGMGREKASSGTRTTTGGAADGQPGQPAKDHSPNPATGGGDSDKNK